MMSKSLLTLKAYGGQWLRLSRPSSSIHTFFITQSTGARYVSDTAAALKYKDDLETAKPYSQVPGPKGLPIVGNILSLPKYVNNENGHEMAREMFKKYGPMYKDRIAFFEIVHLCEINAVEKLHRLEGKYPRRIIVNAWAHWRTERGHVTGILITDGPEWRRMRATLDKRMMRPQHVATYTGNFNEVVTDFIARLRYVRDVKGNGLSVPGIDHELFHWSLETIGTVLYEVRLGGLSDDRLPRMNEFVKAVQGIFASTQKVIYFPAHINRIIFKKWQKLHDDSWAAVFDTTQLLVDEKLQKLKAMGEKSREEAGFLSYLLSTDMSLEEIHANISELMLGAVDTTSNTMQWVLYQLSRNPDIQQLLHDEVTSVVPRGTIPKYEDLQKMPLLKAVVKEVLRMYPVAGVSTRVLNEDLVLCGYRVPAGTTVICSTYQLGRDPSLFSDPDRFLPHRWLRTKEEDHVHTFAWLPFGFGPRMCIGRRVAELEMHLLLARISQTFEVKPSGKEIFPKTRGLIVPERAVDVELVDRV